MATTSVGSHVEHRAISLAVLRMTLYYSYTILHHGMHVGTHVAFREDSSAILAPAQ
jgi:hypothetical protein